MAPYDLVVVLKCQSLNKCMRIPEQITEVYTILLSITDYRHSEPEPDEVTALRNHPEGATRPHTTSPGQHELLPYTGS